MNLSHLLSRALLACALFTGTACDSDTPHGSTPYSELTQEEMKAECLALSTNADIKAFMEAQLEFQCLYSGSMSDSCPDSVSLCQSEGRQDLENLAAQCDNVAVRPTCKATSSEFIACYKAMTSIVKANLSGVNCENAYELLVEGELNSDVPAACQTLQSKCPDALGGEDEEGF